MAEPSSFTWDISIEENDPSVLAEYNPRLTIPGDNFEKIFSGPSNIASPGSS
jgi:hypothetical protein